MFQQNSKKELSKSPEPPSETQTLRLKEADQADAAPINAIGNTGRTLTDFLDHPTPAKSALPAAAVQAAREPPAITQAEKKNSQTSDFSTFVQPQSHLPGMISIDAD